MKTPLVLLLMLLLALLWAPVGHGVHYWHQRPASSHPAVYSRHLLPLRVLRTVQPGHKVVRVVPSKPPRRRACGHRG